MYNILICDDEQIALESLQFIINRNFSEEVKLFTALSGTDALAVTSSEQIDIVFMDINMPGMNGLETVNCILRLKPDTVIIMLSAFDRFQYAQEAMNLGAYKYITKPVNRNVLIEIIRDAMNLVDTRRGKLSDDAELHKKLDIVSPMVESDFIYSCIFSSGNKSDLSTYMDYFSITEKAWRFCCFEVKKNTTANMMELYNQIHDFMHQHIRCLVGSFMVNRMVVFIPVADESESLEEENSEALKKLYTLLSLNVNRSIRIGVSSVESDASLMTQKYNAAVKALNETSAEGGIAFEKNDEAVTSDENPEEILNRVYSRLRIGDGAGVKFLTGIYCSSLYRKYENLDRVKNEVFELLVNAGNIVREVQEDYKNEGFADTFSVLSKSNDLSEIENFLQMRLLECVSAVSLNRQQKENPVVKKACDYIAEHMAEDLSLESVAEKVSVSSFYLSKLFKEDKGETFITYLSDLRLNVSKQLLGETDKSIKEITASVGYNDQNYFSKLFKTKYGLSPTEYRNSIGK